MGFDFVRGKTCCCAHVPTWWAILNVGVGCGWNPAGTGPPTGVRKKDWPGSYCYNDGQRFYAHDARRFAEILQSIIDQPEGKKVQLNAKQVYRWLRSSHGWSSLRGITDYRRVAKAVNKHYSAARDEAAHIAWLLGPEGNACLRSVIDFCRGGSFRIF